MNKESLDIPGELKAKLKEVIPSVFLEDDSIDFDKLKLILGENVNTDNERYSLNWAGKQEAIKVLQTPTTATLAPDENESVNFDDTENIFIEGENLEVLKTLQKSYFGKIKMIYIDPPYNTGNDSFIYPDKFSETKDEYLKRIGEKDAEGFLLKEGLFRKNSRESGRYHSNWLSMMYPRLFLARNLLRDDGVIFVSIDDNEVHNLRLMMNEIFGEENFVSEFVWKSRLNKDNRNLTGASVDHEYVVCYGRKLRGSERKIDQYKNLDADPRGPWTSSNMVGLLPSDQRPNCHFNLIDPRTKINYGKPKMGWRYDKKTMNRLIEENKIIWPAKQSGRPRRKLFLEELKDDYTGYSSIIGVDFYTRDGTAELVELFGFRAIEFPKPTELIKELIVQGFAESDIILDFFAGSGTTAQAVLELNKEDGGNRKFILVQMPEKTGEDSEAYKAGYKSIADICKERIRRVIKKINETETSSQISLEDEKSGDDEETKTEPGFKVFKLKQSNFKLWRTDVIDNCKDLEKMIKLFRETGKEGTEDINIVYELLLKSGMNLNSKIEIIHEGDLNCYSIEGGEILIITSGNGGVGNFMKKFVSGKTRRKVIVLDRVFNGNDQEKANLSIQLRDVGIDFKTV